MIVKTIKHKSNESLFFVIISIIAVLGMFSMVFASYIDENSISTSKNIEMDDLVDQVMTVDSSLSRTQAESVVSESALKANVKLSDEDAKNMVGMAFGARRGSRISGAAKSVAAPVQLKGTGAVCKLSSECSSNYCAGGKCAVKLVGSTCVSGNECIYGYCNSSKKCAKKDPVWKCKANMKNVDCSCSKDEMCTTNYCVNGMCMMKPVDATCTSASECVYNICSGGKCAAMNSGAPCKSSTDCASGICSNKFCLSKVGGSCKKNSDCKDSYCLSGTCYAKKSAEMYCESVEECNSQVVYEGLVQEAVIKEDSGFGIATCDASKDPTGCDSTQQCIQGMCVTV